MVNVSRNWRSQSWKEQISSHLGSPVEFQLPLEIISTNFQWKSHKEWKIEIYWSGDRIQRKSKVIGITVNLSTNGENQRLSFSMWRSQNQLINAMWEMQRKWNERINKKFFSPFTMELWIFQSLFSKFKIRFIRIFFFFLSLNWIFKKNEVQTIELKFILIDF